MTLLMRAYVLPSAGAHTVEPALLPRPQISDDEMLVRVMAVGVGSHDPLFVPRDAQYPYTIGIEASGVIEQLGRAVTGRRRGDRIAFVSALSARGGTWAEYTAVAAGALIVRIPDGVDFVQAAAVPVAASTALRALNALGALPPGASLFIAGGSGAIGTFGIQLARQRGWLVAASASPANHGYLRALGADFVSDYADPRAAVRLRQWRPAGVDAAVAVLPGTAAATLPLVRDGGQLICISGDAVPGERDVRVRVVPQQEDVAVELVGVMADIASGAIRVEVERVYPFEQALDALAKVATRRARGKIVIQVQP